jgi:hypothetical protein
MGRVFCGALKGEIPHLRSFRLEGGALMHMCTDILCVCEGEALPYLRSCHLGHYFMKPGDYQDTLASEILHFTQSVGLLKG